jgi:hypothetical protein
MKKVTTRIKSFTVISVAKKEYNSIQLFICNLFGITPADESKIEMIIIIDYCKGICFYDIIELDNGVLLKIIDKSVFRGWIQAESITKVFNYKDKEFNPKEFTVIGSALDYN